MLGIPFQVIDWSLMPTVEFKGFEGFAFWKIREYPGFRVRLVEYSAGYVADHWCKKGHIVHCLEGDFVSELDNGEEFHMQQGMTYIVSDDCSSHRSRTDSGVKLLIIDGDFLKVK